MQGKLGALRATVMSADVAGGMVFGAAAAAAGGMKDTATEGVSGRPDFSVNATFTSDYRFRGFTQTREKAALQGGLDVIWPNFYVGIWASSVDFGDVLTGSGFKNSADVELVTYAGVKRTFMGYDLDLRAIYYAYPGQNGVVTPGFGIGDLPYFEVMFGMSREILPQLTLSSRVYYSPDYQGEVGRNWVLETGVARKFAAIGPITPTFSALLGSSYGQESKGGFDYNYWNAGVSFVFANYFEFDLRYYDAFDVPSAAVGGTCAHQCDGRVVARITFEN